MIDNDDRDKFQLSHEWEALSCQLINALSFKILVKLVIIVLKVIENFKTKLSLQILRNYCEIRLNVLVLQTHCQVIGLKCQAVIPYGYSGFIILIESNGELERLNIIDF